MKVEIRSMSRRSSAMVAHSLINEGISFEYQHSGGNISGFVVVENPTDMQILFMKRHFTIRTVHENDDQSTLLEDGN